MSIYALERDHLSTLNHSAENRPLQLPREPDSILTGTGWHSDKEISRLRSNYNQNIKEGQTHLESLMLSVAETEANIRTYIVEYIQTKTVLPHLNRLEEVDGQVRMVGRNGMPVINAITADERSGSVLKASVAVEDSLAGTKNRVAVINSPLGHSGLISQDGKMIRYKNNQTMVFWTDEEGGLHGLTIVSDLNRKQSRQLSVDLGVDENLLGGSTEAEQVANIVGSPALFSYGKSISNPAEYVFEKILAIRGNSDIELEQEDGSVEIRSVAQTQEDIEKSGSLLKFKPFWEECLKNWRQKMLAKGSKLEFPIIPAEIVRIIEETILDITVDYLEDTKQPKFKVLPDNVIYFKSPQPELDKYAVASAFLRTRSGCASGGGGSSVALRGVSLGSTSGIGGFVRGFVGPDSKGERTFPCPACGFINERPYEGYVKICQNEGCPDPTAVACGSGSREEEQKEESNVIAFVGSSSQPAQKAA